MPANTRFAVATHLLTVLGHLERGGCSAGPVTSETLAASVNTNAIVVRRLLGKLRDAGLVTGHAGRHGGATLARPTKDITLLDVYRAVDEPFVFGYSRNPPDPQCPVGSCFNTILAEVFEGVHDALEDELRRTRIVDLVDKVARSTRR